MVSTSLAPTLRRSLSAAATTTTDATTNDPQSSSGSTAAPTSTQTAQRTLASAATQTSARMRASAQGTALMAQLSAKLDGANNAAAPAATYEEKLAAYNTAHDAWQKSVDDYWSNMKATRKAGGYVTEQPPAAYAGPAKPVDPNAPVEPAKPSAPSTIPTKQTFLDQAKAVYGFTPDESDEKTWKQAYAKEAVKNGFDGDTVARVYAFETGGTGKADDQPLRKDGTAISTALGYSQVLNATSVDLMAKHGDEWATALDSEGKSDKAAVVRKMAADAKAAGTDWDALQAFAKTPAGRAIHAACLDVDIGPKLQVQNLVDIKNTGAKLGFPSMTPSQLELMNLVGEKNGALMMDPAHADLPTANFFDRAGYEANPVAKNRTASQLLQKIDDSMTSLMKKQGSQDLLDAFSAVSPG